MRKLTLREWLGRTLALVGLLLATLGGVVSSYRTWSLTTGAALDWRLRVLLPDGIGAMLLATGFALATFGTRPLRQVGWISVLVVILGTFIWIGFVVLG